MQTYKTSKARENILGRIRKALNKESVLQPYPEVEQGEAALFEKSDGYPDEIFAENFIRSGGKYVYCDNEQQLMDGICTLYDNMGWQKLFCADKRLLQIFQNYKIKTVLVADTTEDDADACITNCEFLLARTGSVMLSSRQYLGRTAAIYYPAHIIVAYANQVAWDIDDGMQLMQQRYGKQLPSMININTGPSRTADIEKTLVTGVHGPGEVYCFYVNA